jgi:anti-sigma regulatory factor (Ser/Thr protein kinase)
MKPDFWHLARHFAQVMAFSLVISALVYFFNPQRPYEVPLIYSLAIGSCSWAVTDLGRFVIGIDPETAWPRGLRGPLLVAAGIVGGYSAGTSVADAWFGWSSWNEANTGNLLISIVAGVVISGYFYLQGKSSVLSSKVEQVQAQATESQLKLLQTQLEPHMLFNTLANLRVLVGIDPPRAQHMLDHLIAYLRATLSASRATEHALQCELDRLRDYLELMAVRMGPRLTYALELPEALRQASIAPLLLQPLVENCIRHGLEPKVAGGRITVEAKSVGTVAAPMLQITIADTGLGLDPKKMPRPDDLSCGFGLTQVHQRLHTLYGDSCSLNLASPPQGGTVATLTFPLKHLTNTHPLAEQAHG